MGVAAVRASRRQLSLFPTQPCGTVLEGTRATLPRLPRNDCVRNRGAIVEAKPRAYPGEGPSIHTPFGRVSAKFAAHAAASEAETARTKI